MSNNLAKYEILNKEYLRSILDIRSLVKVYSADHSRPKSKPEIIFSISYCELIGSVEGIGFKRYHNPPEPASRIVHQFESDLFGAHLVNKLYSYFDIVQDLARKANAWSLFKYKWY